MKFHVAIILGQKDKFKLPALDKGDGSLELAIDYSGNPKEISNSIWKIIDSNNLNPSSLGMDLCRIAMAAYSADTRISRENAFDQWSRDIVLYLPVSNEKLWSSCKETLENLLGFLSGDHWTIIFRGSDFNRPPVDKKLRDKGRKIDSKIVSLFSGGLDSFIGAVHLLAQKYSPILVGHYNEGTTSKPQTEAFNEIKKKFDKLNPVFLQFYVCPPSGEKESSTRSRSFLFFSLACLVASALGDDAQVVIPENGFIGLNVPLSSTRLGSLSTRTTHPHTIDLFRQIIGILGLPITISVPYRFVTKGEMLLQTKDQEFVKKFASATMSCAHPAASRYIKRNPNTHCGYCVPCIIRRASMNRAGFTDNDYAYDILNDTLTKNKSAHVQSFLTAIAKTPKPNRSNAMRSGPLPGTSDEIRQYIEVYCRGFEEVANFLNKRTVHD